MKISLRCVVVSAALVLLTSMFNAAQDLDDVTIYGTIRDPNNLPIAGATIAITAIESSLVRRTLTDDEGRFRSVELKPGNYFVLVSAEGFAKKHSGELKLLSGQNLRFDVTLSVAEIHAETAVTVGKEDAPIVDTTRIVVGGTIAGRAIEDIPNNARNPLDLVLTLGGTSEEQLSTKRSRRRSVSDLSDRATRTGKLFALRRCRVLEQSDDRRS
jgi:hypothetical protein